MPWRVVAAVTSVLALAGVLAWLLLASPLLVVRDIGVVGADRLEPDHVAALVADAEGVPLARVDTAAAEEVVSGMPLVKEVDVVRAWPSTLEVRLVERVPIAVVPADGGFSMVDADAVVIARVDEPPADLPLLEVDVEAAGAPTLRAVAGVLTGLPAPLRAEVEHIGAATPDDVRLQLRDGAEVRWGSAADGSLKARVLQALRKQEASVYDVSAPLAPVTS